MPIPLDVLEADSSVGWSGNSNICVQGSGHAKTCHRECGVPLEFTLFTPTYRAGGGTEVGSAVKGAQPTV